MAASSYLSSDGPVQNYRGLFNLAVILLLLSHFRLILITIRDHGFALLRLNHYLSGLWKRHEAHMYLEVDYLFFGLAILNAFIVAAYVIESLMSKNILSERYGMMLHYTNAHSSLIITSYIVWHTIENPILNVVLLMHGTVTWMKLISYLHANQDHRLQFDRLAPQRKAAEFKSAQSLSDIRTFSLIENLNPIDSEITYPENITLGNIYYFWFAPTLIYQIAYPKATRVRVLKLFGYVLKFLVVIAIFTFTLAQFVTPELNNLVKELETASASNTIQILAKYWLKLSITNCYLWLLMFYGYFHLYLNFWAELLKFGDRVFYKDWWNSADVSSYWRLWNIPVHYWLVRHIYFPCLRYKMKRTSAMFVVFFVSAVLHELLVSLPFHMIRPWSFLGMMSQIPLVFMTKILMRKFPGSSIGNLIFWITFCVVGQPMAIMLYTIDYQLFNKSNVNLTNMTGMAVKIQLLFHNNSLTTVEL